MSRLILPQEQAVPAMQMAVQAIGDVVFIAMQYPDRQAQMTISYTLEQAGQFVDSVNGVIAQAVANRAVIQSQANGLALLE